MTDRDENKGFSGLSGMVSDVDKGLREAERAAQKRASTQPQSSSTAAPPQPRTERTPAQRSKPSAARPPVASDGGGKNVWLGILGGFVLLFVWIASQDGGSNRTNSPSSSSYSTPSASRPAPAPELPTLSKPSVGTDNVLSSAQIRYCIAEEIRIDSLRPRVATSSQNAAFNTIVDDYNSRCGSYRYREGALTSATRAIEPYRAAIVANGWSGLSLSQPAPQTSKVPRKPDPTVVDIQQGLTDLGYSPGPVDGFFGAKTEQAIREFQRHSSMAVTGQIDADLISLVARSRLALKQAIDTASASVNRLDGEVWFRDMSRRLAPQMPDIEERLRLLSLVYKEAARVDLPPELVLAVIDVESGFDRFALASDGSIGLMQVAPFWVNEIGRPNDNLTDAATNLRYGCTILRYYYDQEEGDLRRTLGRYDGDPTRRAYSNKVIDRLSQKWFKA